MVTRPETWQNSGVSPRSRRHFAGESSTIGEQGGGVVLANLFRQHIALRQRGAEQALREARFDALLIGAGTARTYHEDDLTLPFRSYHHFNHWCPQPDAGHLLWIRPGQLPHLFFLQPQDYWHEHADISDAFWIGEFTVTTCASEADVWRHVQRLTNTAYIGPDSDRAVECGLKTDVTALLARLNWERSFKSEYEIRCTEKATKRAAKGHVAAREAFFAGGSELDIHHAYLRAIRSIEDQLPYPNIVCLNEKAAVLHYHRKRDKIRRGATFLIDAGARYKAYACDISRTYAADDAPVEYRELLGALNNVQQSLCAMIKPGLSFEHLHVQAHREIAGLLLDSGVVSGLSRDHIVDCGLSSAFFPHGLGHMLGICTHDVAGRQSDRQGTALLPNPKWPHLRTPRILDAGNLVTVEPGLYFIPLLINPWRNGDEGKHINWVLIDRLLPCGGIRIEDDVLVTRSGHRNLTRDYLP